jgi:hypothetical protein
MAETGEMRRYHLNESELQKALNYAVRRAKIPMQDKAGSGKAPVHGGVVSKSAIMQLVTQKKARREEECVLPHELAEGRIFMVLGVRLIQNSNQLYPSIAFRSSSGVVIGARLKFSTRKLSTLLETKAGRLGPILMFLIPR